MSKLVAKTKILIWNLFEKRVRERRTGRIILNEAVNFEKACIFIAVPKTGTTSVRVQMQQQGQPVIGNPHLDILQVRDSLYVYFLKKTLGQNREFPSDDVPSDQAIREQAADVFQNFFKFSAVRNPWARTLSIYSRREGVQLGKELSFDDFCEQHVYASDTCFHPTRHRNQLDWLCDENGECLMDYVYKVENFKGALSEIEERTNGRIKLAFREANKNPNSKSNNYQKYYSDRARKLIAKHFEKDIDYFKYTF